MRISTILLILLLSSNLLHAQKLLWEQTIGGNDTDWLHHAFQNRDGNYVFSGYSHSSISRDKTDDSRGFSDFWIVETNPDGEIIWQKTLGGNFYDMIVKTLELQDGSYILAGTSYSGISGEKNQPNHGERDLWLVKLDPNRNIVWQRNYGGNATDVITDIIATPDGGFLAVANSSSDISGEKTTAPLGHADLWVLKLNDLGEVEWQKGYGGNGIEINGKVLQTGDGNFLLAAASSSGISGNKTDNTRGLHDYWVLKINPAGEILWQKTIGGDNGDTVVGLVPTADGGYIVGGDSASGISGDKTVPIKSMVDLWLVKISASGDIVWQQDYAGADNTEWLTDIIPTKDNGFLVTAMSGSGIGNDKTEPNRGDRDYWMFKINSEGNICWDKTLGGSGPDQPMDAFEDQENNLVMGGWTDSFASGDKTEDPMGGRDFWITKISQPEITTPVAFIPEPLIACDRNEDGYTEFNIGGLEQEILGGRQNLEVSYFDGAWNELPSPLPNPFTNTQKNEQIINVVLRDKDLNCAETSFQILLQVSFCGEEEPGNSGNDSAIGFPPFFTPNGDGYHDTWKADISLTGQLHHIHIYDRYGKLLKQLKQHESWDGRSGGSLMPSDDYWYRALTSENREITGHFTLLR